MKLFKALPIALFVASYAATVLPTTAQELNTDHLTKVTLSGPVSIPAVHIKGFSVLPAGTYMFRLVDLQGANQHVVQIFNEDKSKIIATILAVPDYHVKPSGNTVITFRERPDGQPPALRTWFFPGESWGEDFVYSKAQAQELAAANAAPVMFTPTEQQNDVDALPATPPTADTPVMAYQPTGQEVQPAEVAGSAPAPVEMAQNTPPAVAPPAPTPSPEPATTLPQTAGELPLIGLCGLLALGGALLVRSVQHKVSDAVRHSASLQEEI